VKVFEAGGDRALLFTSSPNGGHLLKAHLEKRFPQEVPFSRQHSKVERQAMVRRFQDDPRGPQLFLLSPEGGGVASTLTRARHSSTSIAGGFRPWRTSTDTGPTSNRPDNRGAVHNSSPAARWKRRSTG